MNLEGVDYSYNPPDPAELYRLGKRFAVRYIGTPTIAKNLTVADANGLRAAGLDIVAVCQQSKTFVLGGYDVGRTAAQEAVADAAKYGMPSGRPIYFALDTNPTTFTAEQWSAVEGFFAGAASVMGRGRVGVYGGLLAIERLVPTHATYGWQTYAWSGGQLSSKARLYQYQNGVSLADGLVDLDRSLHADYGQWGYGSTEPPREELEMPYPVIRCNPADPQYAGREAWYALTPNGPLHVPNLEYQNVGRAVGLLGAPQTVNARAYDVAVDLARRLDLEGNEVDATLQWYSAYGSGPLHNVIRQATSR